MKHCANRHLQLSLRLAAQAPTAIPVERDEELVLALVDLLMDAISTLNVPETDSERSRDEQR
jgi:hypothetical protein